MTNIHPTAIIYSGATLADDVTIGPYACIGENVSIGSGTEVMAHAIIDGHTAIGSYNKIYPSASIGLPPQDLKYKGEKTCLKIGDYNHIREFSTIHCSNSPDEDTTVGSHNLIMAYAHIAHNCHIGNSVVLANVASLAGHVIVEDFVTIGGLTAVLQFVKVGCYAFVGGASGLRKDIPPYTRGQGTDRYKISGINSIGLERKGFTTEQIEAIKKVYKIFYHSHLNVSQAIELAESLPDLTTEQQIFIDFCKNSTRGINRHYE